MFPNSDRQNEVKSENFQLYSADKCRVCLKLGDISIFDREEVLQNFIEFGAVEICENDNLPKHLCNCCHLLLEAAVLFREKAKKTDDILKNLNNHGHDFEDNQHEYRHVIKRLLVDAPGHRFLTYETSDSEEIDREPESSYNNVDSTADNSSVDDTKTEKEYLIVKNETESESNTECDGEKSGTYMVIVSNEEQHNLETDKFTCSTCSMTFNSMGELENHNELEHKIKVTDKMNCGVCGEFVSRAYYKVHIKHHREKYKQKKKKCHKVECKVCRKMVNQSYYSYHLKMHGSDVDKAGRTRLCIICNKTFSLNYYNEHMKRVHMIASNGETLKNIRDIRKQKHIQCPVCDKKIREHKYKEHLANHGKPPKKYVCDHCGKVFIYRSAFTVHLLTHGGDLKHKCQFCDYQAVHQGLLKVHVRIHTGDYNYKCTECPASFTTKSNLSQHIKRHKGPGCIKCYDCERMFHRQRNMEEHHKTIHLKIKDVMCDICGKGFSHRDRMLSHQLKVHNRDRLPRHVLPAYLKFKKETRGVSMDN